MATSCTIGITLPVLSIAGDGKSFHSSLLLGTSSMKGFKVYLSAEAAAISSPLEQFQHFHVTGELTGKYFSCFSITAFQIVKVIIPSEALLPLPMITLIAELPFPSCDMLPSSSCILETSALKVSADFVQPSSVSTWHSGDIIQIVGYLDLQNYADDCLHMRAVATTSISNRLCSPLEYFDRTPSPSASSRSRSPISDFGDNAFTLDTRWVEDEATESTSNRLSEMDEGSDTDSDEIAAKLINWNVL